MLAIQSEFDPGFAKFGGGAASSVLHPLVALSLVGVIALMFVLPRKNVIVPLLLGILIIPAGQNLYIGVHLYVYRLLILSGWLRLLWSRSPGVRLVPGGLSTLDKLFIVWALFRFFAVVALFREMSAVTNQVAFLLDSLGGYFLFRSLVRDESDARKVAKIFVVVALVSAALMLIELKTGQNLFGYLGGIRLMSDIRNGRIRAQGVFEHSILAGSFGAVAFPLSIWLWKRWKSKFVAALGIISSSIMVFASASSTPVAAWAGTFMVIAMWPIRKNMRIVRWGIVAALLGLQLVMKAPVWYIMAHIDFAGGSSGWNRANLIDTYLRHFSDWWLIGTNDNANWGWDMWDQCNQFVTEGETGGLICLVCFIAMFVICFKMIGTARRSVEGNTKKEWVYWLLGATIFAQLMACMGVDYFDQSRFVWYVLLVMIPITTMIPRRSSTEPVSVETAKSRLAKEAVPVGASPVEKSRAFRSGQKEKLTAVQSQNTAWLL